jgi:hypothetical protein
VTKSLMIELKVGPLALQGYSRDIPENRMADGTVMGILEAAAASNTLPQLMTELTRGLEAGLARYSSGLPDEPEAHFVEHLAKLREKGLKLLDAIDVDGHLRACDACWRFRELDESCPEGKVLLDRIVALERALGMRA